jgi:hypothetical protein
MTTSPSYQTLAREHLAADEAEWRARYFTEREIVRAALDALQALLQDRDALTRRCRDLTEQVQALMAVRA